MSIHRGSVAMIVIQCASCGKTSQVDPSLLGQVVECPLCRQPTPAVAVPPAPPTSPPKAPPAAPATPPPPPPPTESAKAPPPPISPPPGKEPPPAPNIKNTPPKIETAKAPAEVTPEPPPEPKRKRVLTREERLAIRRRWHLILAIGGGVLLAIIAALLADRG